MFMAEKKLTEVRFGPAVVDADGAVVGRLASKLAKRLLMGERIVVVNAERAVITGEKHMVEKRYLEKLQRGDRIKGPFYPKYPDRLLKRAVRGMLPYKQQKGELALKRLRIYMGIPEGLADKPEKFAKQVTELTCKYITVGDLCEALGAKPRWK